MTKNVDLIIIGGGPGGYDVAAHEAAAGKSVVLIEKDLLGGTCLNRGCIPTKCLCAGAEVLEYIRNASLFGISVGDVHAPFAEARERSVSVISTLRDGIASLLSKCEVINGVARICPDGSVDVNGKLFKAPKTLIATGSSPAVLPIDGAKLAMTSDDFLKLESLPERLVIVGGGVIGIEFAYIASAYGTEVTVLEYCKEILPPFDSEVAKRLRMLLSQKGINFVTSAQVTSLRETTEGIDVTFTDKKGEQVIQTNAVVMAVGRRPVIPDGLAEAGIAVDQRGFIVTDDDMQTSRAGFYAVGDCNGRMMLAHVATAQSMRAIGRDVNLSVIPSAVFAQPELAMVGLTTEQCKDQSINYVVHKALYRANGKALASGHPDGMVKVLVDPETELILGCHILGAHASDLIQEAALAMSQRITVAQVGCQTVHGHPTLSEILANALQ